MTADAATALAGMLQLHPQLEAVNLSDTSLGDDGIAEILDALIPATSLRVHSPPPSARTCMRNSFLSFLQVTGISDD